MSVDSVKASLQMNGGSSVGSWDGDEGEYDENKDWTTPRQRRVSDASSIGGAIEGVRSTKTRKTQAILFLLSLSSC